MRTQPSVTKIPSFHGECVSLRPIQRFPSRLAVLVGQAADPPQNAMSEGPNPWQVRGFLEVRRSGEYARPRTLRFLFSNPPGGRMASVPKPLMDAPHRSGRWTRIGDLHPSRKGHDVGRSLAMDLDMTTVRVLFFHLWMFYTEEGEKLRIRTETL